jgi:hypothetical protein
MDISERSLIDHVIVATRNLDEASRRWEALGFNLSDPGAHPTRGTVNRCIPFPNAYVELLAPNPAGCEEEFLLKTLALREGGTSVAFAMRSGEAAHGGDASRSREQAEQTLALPSPAEVHQTLALPSPAEVHQTLARLIPGVGPPVTGSRDILSQSGRERISFDVQRVPNDALWPGRFFFCGHHHPDRVYQTELFKHPNGAIRLERIVHFVPSLPTVWPVMIEKLGFRRLGQDAETLHIDCAGIELILANRAALPRLMPKGLVDTLPDAAAPVMLGFAGSTERWVSARDSNGIVLHFKAQ